MQLALAESARVTTSEESRFRIDYPNSRPRRSCIIALDPVSGAVLHRLAGAKARPNSRFLRYVEPPVSSELLPALPARCMLEHIDGGMVSLISEVGDADIVVMVIEAGAAADAAEVIGNACYEQGKIATGVMLNSTDVSPETLSKALIAFRPFTTMLVVSRDEEYVVEMLDALRV
jgi:hypothetical protein